MIEITSWCVFINHDVTLKELKVIRHRSRSASCICSLEENIRFVRIIVLRYSHSSTCIISSYFCKYIASVLIVFRYTGIGCNTACNVFISINIPGVLTISYCTALPVHIHRIPRTNVFTDQASYILLSGNLTIVLIVFNFRCSTAYIWCSDTWISLIYRFVLADQASNNIRSLHGTFVAIPLNIVTICSTIQCTNQASNFFLSIDLSLILVSTYPYAGGSTDNSTGIAV